MVLQDNGTSADKWVNRVDLLDTNNTEKISNQIAKSNTNKNDITTSNKEWKKGTTLVMGDPAVSGLMEKRMCRNWKIKVRYFFDAKSWDMYHNAIPLLDRKPDISYYILVQTMHHINLGQIFWMKYCIWRTSSKKNILIASKLLCLLQLFAMTMKNQERR